MVHRHVVWLGFSPSLFLYSNALLNQITNQLYFRKYSSLGGAFLQHVFSQVQKFLLTSPLTTKVKQCSYNRSIKIKISRRRKCSFFSFWPFCFCILCRYCCCCFIRPYFYHFITASRGVAINVQFSSLFLRYEGQYVNNQRHGQGTFWYPDGSVYDGDWTKGQRNGYGVYIYANGDKYLGMWKEDRRHGQGEYIYKDYRLKYKGKSPASYFWS